MNAEETQLLLKDLCGRLPYGVVIEITSDGGMVTASYDMRLDAGLLADLLHSEDDFKPYLRPMSSMTPEEKNTFEFFVICNTSDTLNSISWTNIQNLSIVRDSCDFIDWLNEHHFDYRGLIEKGLALEAPEDMYKTE